MQGSEPKTPGEGAPELEGTSPALPEGGLAREASERSALQDTEKESGDLETPRAASMSRSAPDAPASETDVSRQATWSWRSLFRLRLGTHLALAIAGGAAAVLGFVLGPMASRTAAPASSEVTAATLAAAVAAAEAVADSGLEALDAASAVDALPPRPAVWRVAELADDTSVSIVVEAVGHRPLLAVLSAAKASPAETQRVIRSLTDVRSVDHLNPKDELSLAFDKATGRVVAFELASSPFDVWQAREEAGTDGVVTLLARKLDLPASRVRVGRAVLVGADLRASLSDAGLTPVDDVLSLLDDALEGHAELSDIRPGARLRLLATQEQVDGAFVRWVSLDAVEYFPASPAATAVRVYAFGDGDLPGESRKRRGWYDGKGRQPFHGGFRSPVPLARVASRFNPHRMHPVLHVVMPHNGVDFAAPLGAPVYATAAGVVASVGNDGPCGNKVEISHAGGITSVYCHLSRFASGLRVGQRVEQRQLIAYVGQTGRVTGPHLHFGIRKNGVFVDPMTLRLDGFRVVPRSLRDEFDRLRAELDAQLDGVPLPAPGAAPVESPESETIYEEP